MKDLHKFACTCECVSVCVYWLLDERTGDQTGNGMNFFFFAAAAATVVFTSDNEVETKYNLYHGHYMSELPSSSALVVETASSSSSQYNRKTNDFYLL